MAAGAALKRVQIQNCVGLCHATIDMHFFVVSRSATHRQNVLWINVLIADPLSASFYSNNKGFKKLINSP